MDFGVHQTSIACLYRSLKRGIEKLVELLIIVNMKYAWAFEPPIVK